MVPVLDSLSFAVKGPEVPDLALAFSTSLSEKEQGRDRAMTEARILCPASMRDTPSLWWHFLIGWVLLTLGTNPCSSLYDSYLVDEQGQDQSHT